MAHWSVEIDGFSEVGLEADTASAARWKAAKACFDAGYGDTREGPFSLVRRGISVRQVDDIHAAVLRDSRHWVD